MLAYAAERYRSLAPMYYRGAAAAIVVYDITKKVPLPYPSLFTPVPAASCSAMKQP